MIRSFADKRTRELFETGTAKGFPLTWQGGLLESSSTWTWLCRLHALRGDREGQHAIAVNDQWRVCFRFSEGDAYDVEVCDYQ